VFLGGWEWPWGGDAGVWLQLIWTFVKTSLFIVAFIWIRFSFPRLRIDQLMSYCWKVLIPLAFLQIFLNGLVLAYDGPDGLLLITSGAGLALAMFIVYRVVRGEPRRLRLFASRGGGERTVVVGEAGSI
jgi:hypothetical protein